MCPVHVRSSHAPADLLVIADETGTNPALVVRFEATSRLLNQQAIRSIDGGSVDQMAIAPDGSQLIIASSLTSSGTCPTRRRGHTPWCRAGWRWTGDRIYAITQAPGEPNVVTLRIRDLA